MLHLEVVRKGESRFQFKKPDEKMSLGYPVAYKKIILKGVLNKQLLVLGLSKIVTILISRRLQGIK